MAWCTCVTEGARVARPRPAVVDARLMTRAHRSLAVFAQRVYVPAMSPSAALITADELLHMHLPDKRVELVRGGLVVRGDRKSVV